MRARPGTDPLSWDAHVERHATARWGQHRTWRFFPWHRAQLLFFERIIQRESGNRDFALPYLNWEKDVVPAVFFSALSHRPRRVVSTGEKISAWAREEDWEFFNAPTLAPFRTLFGTRNRAGGGETQGHGIIHTFVGGDMSSTVTAPNDPIFWCHHSNVDRVWAAWQARNGSFVRGEHTYDPAWLADRVEGFVDETGAPVPPVHVNTLVETTPLGYRYDDLNIVAAFMPAVRRNTTEPLYEAEFVFETAEHGVAWLWLPEAFMAHVRGAGFEELEGYVEVRLSSDANCKLALHVQDGQHGTPQQISSAYPIPMGSHGDGHAEHAAVFRLAADNLAMAIQNFRRPVLRVRSVALLNDVPAPRIVSAAYAHRDVVVFRENLGP